MVQQNMAVNQLPYFVEPSGSLIKNVHPVSTKQHKIMKSGVL